MPQSHPVRFGFVALALLIFGSVCGSKELPNETPRELFFPSVHLPKGTRIAAIRIYVYVARVSAMQNIPPDWQVSLELDGNYRTQIRGNCQHGAGGLDRINQLDRLIVAASGNWSEVKVEGVIYVTKDFEALEEIKITDAQIEFRLAKPVTDINSSASK